MDGAASSRSRPRLRGVVMVLTGAIAVAGLARAAAAQSFLDLDQLLGERRVELGHPALDQFVAFLLASPIINAINLLLLVLALGLFAWFVVTVNTRRMMPPEFVDEITKLVVRGKHDAAGDLCRAHRRVFIAKVVQRCVDNADKRHGVLMEMLEAEGRRRADVLWNRLSYLADISSVAPLLGLLGTVMGMIQVFFALGEEANPTTATVSAGVAEALATTMVGLTVGIVALVLYSLSKARFTRALADAEGVVHSIADHMKREAE